MSRLVRQQQRHCSPGSPSAFSQTIALRLSAQLLDMDWKKALLCKERQAQFLVFHMILDTRADGRPTFRPGTWLYQAAKHCECWAATPAAAPLGPRNTIGQLMVPADMYSVLAAELMIWSMACIAKLKVMNSQMGLSPLNAAPTAMPVNPACRAHAAAVLKHLSGVYRHLLVHHS